MVSHTVLLVVGGALLTGLLGAVVFGSDGTAEERRIREQQKLLRALEAQRRVRDMQLMRQAKRQGQPYRETQPAPRAEAGPVADEQVTEIAPRVDRRATELQHKRDEKEQAAALKLEREAEKRARQQAERERKSAAKAEQITLRAVEQQQKQEAKAALKEEQAKIRAAEARAQPQPTPPPAARSVALEEETKPLTELPLFSWAHDIEDDDAPSREAS